MLVRQTFGNSNASFPLAPTLSRGERETWPSGSWCQCASKNVEAFHELLVWQTFGNSNVSFPLTPTLSPGERETWSSGSWGQCASKNVEALQGKGQGRRQRLNGTMV